MNELHPNPFPAMEEPDSMEACDIPMQQWGVGHRTVLGDPSSLPMGGGMYSIQRSSSAQEG